MTETQPQEKPTRIWYDGKINEADARSPAIAEALTRLARLR